MTTSRSIASPTRRSDRLALVLAALVAAAALAPRNAEAARKRVVVLPFDGPQGETAQEEVAGVIKRKHAVVPADSFMKKRRELGVRNDSDESTARVAQALGVDAVVNGQVKRKGGKWELDIAVRDGGSGGIVEQIVIPLKGPRIDSEATQRIAPELLPALLRADGRSGEGGGGRSASRGGDEGGGDEAGGGDEGEEEATVKRKPKKKKKAGEDEEGGDEEEPIDENGGWLPLRTLEAGAGFGGLGRSFAYDDADLQAYGSGLALSVLVLAETFPLQSQSGFLGKMGMSVFAQFEPINKAKLADTSLSVVQRRLYVDFRYAMRMGENFLLLPNVGIGQSYFGISDKEYRGPSNCKKDQDPQVICLADVIVTFAKVGADVKLAMSPTMTLLGELSVLPGVTVQTGDGQIAGDPEDGAADRVLGFGGGLGLSYKMMDILALRASLNFVRFGHTLTPSVDTAKYTSATDSYYGLTVAGVYLLK